MKYTDALDSALQGNCLLFLGAGFSLGATTLDGENILSSRKLARQLCREVNEEETDDLQLAADDFLQLTEDTDMAINTLNKFLKVTAVMSYHQEIASLPWRYVYTTNYDNTYEFARLACSKNYKSVTLSENINSLSVKDHLVIHLNGSIENLNKETLTTEFRLTNASYATSEFMASSWYQNFINNIKRADAIFFIGYSMYDIEIQRIFATYPELKEKTFLIIGTENSPREKRQIAQYGEILEFSTDTFSKDILGARRNFSIKETPKIYPSFRVNTINSYDREVYSISNEDIFQLFIFGRYCKNKIFYDLVLNNLEVEYYLPRKELYSIMDVVKNKQRGNIIIQSDFGNGKTMLLEGVKVLCARESITCYELNDESDETAKDIEHILQNTTRQVIIIENYSRFKASIQQITVSRRPDNTTLILTERTAANTVYQDRLAIEEKNIYLVTLDKLTGNDLENLIKLFDKNGLWKKLAHKSPKAKLNLFLGEYQSSLASILLGVIESHDMQVRLGTIFSELDSNAVFKQALTVVCIMNIIGEYGDIHEVFDIIEKKLQNRILFDINPVIKNLCNNQTYHITIKSPIFAKFILKKLSTQGSLVSILTKIYKYYSARIHLHHAWRICHELDRFAAIQLILPDTKDFQAFSDYFDAIGFEQNNKNNYHYWLQYATACMVYKDFDKADFYFQTAYSLYQNTYRGGDEPHRMLDNQYARFLILKASTVEMSSSDAFKIFETSSAIVKYQLGDKRTVHYPYRVATLYKNFYIKYEAGLSDAQKEFIKNDAKSILVLIQEMKDTGHPSIRDCKLSLETLMTL